jgi:hypothetical protein
MAALRFEMAGRYPVVFSSKLLANQMNLASLRRTCAGDWQHTRKGAT